ncbi:hypothetical protein CLAIMM_04555, partial [Cladophialophora immunda]
MVDEYMYHRLPQDYVRFVEVYSDARDAPLRCRIFPCRLQSAPPFEALSYVWGPQQPLYDFQCTGEPAGLLGIGPNLYNALLNLRFHPSGNPPSRLLWIDRVCINQSDVIERASQVLLMGFIYRKCQQVLVWLGEDDPITKEAFECATYIYENDLGRRETSLKHLAQFRCPP